MFEEPHNLLFYPKRLSMNPNIQVQIMCARCLYYTAKCLSFIRKSKTKESTEEVSSSFQKQTNQEQYPESRKSLNAKKHFA